jgi:PAS domain S-box-containing protein
VLTRILWRLAPLTPPGGLFWLQIGPALVRALSELPYRDLFRSTPQPLFLVDEDDVCVDASEAGAALVGLSREQLLGRNLLTLLSEGSGADVASARDELKATGVVVRHITIEPEGRDPFPAEAILSTTSSTTCTLVHVRDRRRQLEAEGALRELREMHRLSQPGERIEVRGWTDMANAALERLCQITGAEAGIAVLVDHGGGNALEASRGTSPKLSGLFRGLDSPALVKALSRPGAMIQLDALGGFEGAAEAAAQLAAEGLTSGQLIGLRRQEETIGLLALASRSPVWVGAGPDLISEAATQLVSALDNARLMERLRRGLEEERRLTGQLEALMGLTLLPQGEADERTGAQFLLERVVAALGAEGGFAVRLVDADLDVVAAQGAAIRVARAVAARPAESFAFWQRLLDHPEIGTFQMTAAELLGSEPPEGGLEIEAEATCSVSPLREGDRVTGAFVCQFAPGPDPVDERTLEAVGRIVSIAYANVRMSRGLNEAAEHERRLTAELRALQELTLLGASTDDVHRLAQETIEAVAVATGATGGGYVLIDPSRGAVEPIVWVGQPSRHWKLDEAEPATPSDWPALETLEAERVWLSREPPEPQPPPPSDEKPSGRTTRVHPDSQAVLPLHVDGRISGALHLEWSETPWKEQLDGHFLEPIGRICSISLANFRLRSELLHRAAAQRALSHRLDTLDELTRIGEEASSFEELAHRTVSLVREALGATGVCYLLMEPGHHFETHAVAGEAGAFRPWLKGVPARDVPGGQLMLTGGGSSLGDFMAGEVSERVLPMAQTTGFQAYGAIPIRTGEELAGALLCFFEQPTLRLTIDEAALDSVARIGGIALANFRLRERLVASEERYRTLFEESPDAFFVSALDGTVLDANEAAVRLYHVNRGEILGRYFGQFISADEREMARRRQIVWTQGRGTFKDRARRPDGSEFPVEVEVRVVELGGQRRFLSLVRDLSDQERLTNELLQAQKMEAIGQLVSGVAHELNNPLAAIIAFSQLIRSDERLPEDMRHDAGLLVQESDRTRRIVQSLLDFARQRPPERRPASISALIQSVLELQSYALSTNHIEVAVDIPATIPDIDLDRAQLQQVLLNLTINAIQAIRDVKRSGPSHLWITASLPRPGRGAKADKPHEERVRVTVRDDGPGVPEAARARLFDPFFTTKQPGEGTGLGLSVSFGIVAAHGGRLWYEPGPKGVGSSFIIELPVRAGPIDERQFVEAVGRRPTRHEAPSAAAAKNTAPQPALAAAALADKAAPEGAPEPATEKRAAARAAKAAAGEGTPKAAARAVPAKPATKRAGRPRKQPVPTEAPPREQAASTATPVPADQGAIPSMTATIPTRFPASQPFVLAVDDEPSIRAFLRKALTAAGINCVPAADGANALEALRDTPFDVMLIDHRMAGMSGTEFYEAAVDFRPEMARRAVFMSGDVLNPDLRGFATDRGIRLLAKPFDIEAVVRVVREVLAAGDDCEAEK